MDPTPTFSRFDDAYKTRTAPWVIGEPQPAIVELERAGLIRGKVLDVGCGTGEHTILLTRLGYDVLGVDSAPTAVEQARENAAAKGVDARFEVADAMNLGAEPALRHDRRQRAVPHLRRRRPAPATSRACTPRARPGALVHVLALSDAGRGFGPEVSEATIREAFGDGWELEALDETTYRGVVTGGARRGARPAGRHGGRRARLAGARPPPLTDFACADVARASLRTQDRSRIGIAGVGDVESVPHERAQARQHVAPRSSRSPARMAAASCGLVGEAESVQRGATRRRSRRAVRVRRCAARWRRRGRGS